jgi:hypothetical protein
MNLRTRLLILVIAAMLVPAILVGLRFVQNRTSEIDAALANLSATANDISNDLDEKIQGTAQLHYGLARARDLDTSDKAACSAFLSAVRRIHAVHRHIDHHSGRRPVLRLAADQPDPRSQGSYLLQAGPGCARHRHDRARIRPADGDLGAADRLSRSLRIRGAEIHPARLVQPEEIRRVSREALGERQPDSACRPQRHGPRFAPGKRLARAGRVDCGFGAVPVCNLS